MGRELTFLRQEVGNLGEFRDDMEHRLGEMVHHVRHELATSDEELKVQLANVRSDFSAARPESDDSSTLFSESVTESADVQTSESGMPIATLDPFNQPSAMTPGNVESITSRLADALQNNGLSMQLQPIVEFKNRQPAYFDAFMRLPTGNSTYLDQHQFLQLAEQGELLSSMDKKVISSSIRMLHKLSDQKKSAGVVCALSSDTLNKQKSFDKILVNLSENEQFCDSLVIEIRQRDFQLLNSKARKRVRKITELGFRLNLSQSLDLNMDLEELADFGFRFVKVPASILIHAEFDERTTSLNPALMAKTLEEAGIQLIATDVERDSDALALIDFDVPFGQGSLFAPARPVKSELLTGDDLRGELIPHKKTGTA